MTETHQRPPATTPPAGPAWPAGHEVDARTLGPKFTPAHPLALEPAVAPPHSVDGFARTFLRELNFGGGASLERSTTNHQYLALARTVRHYLMADWLKTARRRRQQPKDKMVGYLSAEYLLGRQLGNALLAQDLAEIVDRALASCGLDLEELRSLEVEPGLGNGGLGRLAACFIDSLATMDVSCIGYGIRYEYGIFRQTFVEGRQSEQPDGWLSMGAPWEFPNPERAVQVDFGGHTEEYTDESGQPARRWVPGWNVLGVPYNYMVPGYRNGVVNTLRLWSAQATSAFDLSIFNAGDYAEAVRAQTFAENISKVLYPEDSTPQGRELRLQQQYFFVACSLKDYINGTLPVDFDVRELPERIIFQLNDTHPVIAVPELMRLLIDEHGLEWDEAWGITAQCFAYTCHTLLPEALEVWPVELLGRLLPRHLEIIFQINEEFLAQVGERWPDDMDRIRRMSIISDGDHQAVRMAHLAAVAATKINGVAALHSQLLRDKVLVDFAEMWPDKFTNVTNGITPRRFIQGANPALSDLITDTIGEGWVTDLDRLAELEPYADDADFRAAFRDAKFANKQRLGDLARELSGPVLHDDHMVDVMVKRLHEYKRQSLKLLHVVSIYEQVLSGALDPADIVPRTVVFGAKAAPGYWIAKETMYLINRVAATINADPKLNGRLQVWFPENYNVTLAQLIIPAADLSEQISLAGKEASGTGNMKFALNGALTIGTDDGANVEIRQLVGDDNFFLFGLSEPEVSELGDKGYRSRDFYENNETLRRAIDLVASGHFNGGGTEEPVIDDLLNNDRFLALADFESYAATQQKVEEKYRDREAWTRSAILNVARCGFFSSDRSMRDYIERIWKLDR
ncbi:MAG TPA: glycogen/starch/alpha-glucan phosphorylase [Propionibacterium sp.]|nr:glycogen/starch/alpha-glucan phosphorylase [Propionibacterium sp.]